MTYEITLISADIKSAMDGTVKLAIVHEGKTTAKVNYHWNDKQFTATFEGHAPTMPHPAHPTVFIEHPIAAINKLKSDPSQLPSDVLQNNRVYILKDNQVAA